MRSLSDVALKAFTAIALATVFLALPRAATAQHQREVPQGAVQAVGEQLVGAYSASSPFTPDAPDHLWFDNGDGTYLFLHFDNPLSEAARLLFVGWAVPGRWCAEDQPSAEFTHFPRIARVGDWNAGHGGATPGESGYWLKHVAVERIEMPAMMGMPARTIGPGADRGFMPTKAPSCGG